MHFFMNKIPAQMAAAIGFSITLYFAFPALAMEAVLKDIEITNTDTHLLLYFRVADCFTEDMKDAIDSGIHATFRFFVRVYEVRDRWRDKKIADLKMNHDVQYDNLKRVYLVHLTERDDNKIIVQDFENVMKLMSEVAGFKVADLQKLKKGGRYRIFMMAELDKIRLPFYLHNVFFFLSLWDFETDWYTVDFTY